MEFSSSRNGEERCWRRDTGAARPWIDACMLCSFNAEYPFRVLFFCMLDSTIPPFHVLHAWRCLHSPQGIIAVVLFGLVGFGLGWPVRVGGWDWQRRQVWEQKSLRVRNLVACYLPI